MSSKRASGSKSVVKPKPHAAGGKRPNSKFRNDFKMPKLSGKKRHRNGVEKKVEGWQAGMGKPLGQPVVNPTHQRQLNDSTEGGRPSIVEPNVNAEGFCRAVISLGKSGRQGCSETSSSTYCLQLDIAFVELYYWNMIEILLY